MHIALFGTSADPPTVGHQEILVGLAQQFDQVVVWASDNPFKTHGATLAARTQMLELVVAEANDRYGQTGLRSASPRPAKIHLCPDLSDRYTIVTLERAQSRWPAAHFTLVIGSDLLTQIQQWYRADELLAQVHLLVVPRPDFAIQTSTLQALEQQGTTLAIAHWQGLPVSSTAFREAGHTPALTPPVYHFICQHHLYSTVYTQA